MSGIVGDNVGRSSGVVKAAGGGKTIKRHSFEFATRTAGTTTAGDQFEWTDAFVPTDPVNNSFWCEVIMPTQYLQQGHSGNGLRFDDGSSTDDYFGRGVSFTRQSGNFQSGIHQNFNIPAGDLAAGTFTITYRTETNDSSASFYCPNSTDGARLATQTRATLLITEYKN